MTPPRPTNETPSAGAVAKSLTEIEVPGDRCESYLCEHWLTEATLALDAFAREQAHWRCDLCHCCGEKRHDGGDPCVSCESTARAPPEARE